MPVQKASKILHFDIDFLHFSKAIAFAFGDRNTVKLNSLGVKLLILRIAVDFLSCRFILLRNTSKIRKV